MIFNVNNTEQLRKALRDYVEGDTIIFVDQFGTEIKRFVLLNESDKLKAIAYWNEINKTWNSNIEKELIT